MEELTDELYITRTWDNAGKLKSFQEHFVKAWMRGTEAEKKLLDIKAFRAMFPLKLDPLLEGGNTAHVNPLPPESSQPHGEPFKKGG